MKLKDIITGCSWASLEGSADVEIKDIQFDSRRVTAGTVFVAQRGTQIDGHAYIEAAIAQGAAAVVCETMPEERHEGVTYIVTPDSGEMLGEMASNYYGRPSERLRLIGITGTNGKTTTVTLLHRLMRALGHRAGLLSTIVNKIDDEEEASTHTTPDALATNALLRRMADRGCEYCFMEVSSHAIVQKRIAGLRFAGGIFSNLTHDHLDYHGTMARYIEAKKAFFDGLPREAFALTNIDDRNGRVMVQNTAAAVKTYSMRQIADYRCKVKSDSIEGMEIALDGEEMWTRLVGRFNAYNLTAIYATALLCGEERGEVLRELSALRPAEGRFAQVQGRGLHVIVDYAHTPDALENVIDTINEIRRGGEKLITVVGCGGDRDKTKRPEMAQIAATKSDRVILTSDNPRTEDPEAILDDMERGLSSELLSGVVRIADRRQALRTAVLIAREGDIILVAGKGHEKYQDIKGVKHHFDDVEEVEKLLRDNE